MDRMLSRERSPGSRAPLHAPGQALPPAFSSYAERISHALVVCAFLGVQAGCASSGPDAATEAAASAGAAAPECTPGTTGCVAPTGGSGGTPARDPKLKPTVPAVPDSPIRANCAKLPTQVERDTCTNRKDSTG